MILYYDSTMRNHIEKAILYASELDRLRANGHG